MGRKSAIVFALLVCMVLVASHAESAACDSVYKNLSPCQSALKQGGEVSASCCSGIKTLNNGATTKAARKSACECIKKLASSYKVNAQTASGVLKKCNVDVGIPISANVDCNRLN